MFVVYLPPMRGKVAGWLRSTTWTTYEDRAQRFATEADAQAGIERARKFHLKTVMKAAQIKPIVMAEIFNRVWRAWYEAPVLRAADAPSIMLYEFDAKATEDQDGDVHVTTFSDGSKFHNDAATGETRWEVAP
jgi:hypothetical protein